MEEVRNRFFVLKDKLEWFFNSWYYLIMLAIITVLGWGLNITFVSYFVLVGCVCLSLLICKDITPTLITLTIYAYVFNEYPITTTYYWLFGIGLLLAIPCLIFYLIRRIKYDKYKLTLGKYFWWIVALCVVFTLGGIFSQYASFMGSVFGFIIFATTLVIYFLAHNFSKISSKDLIFKILLLTSVVIIIELWISLIETGDVIYAIQNKRARVGIGEINLPALTIGMFVPVCLAWGVDKKYSFIYLISSVFVIFNVVLTCSRGALLFTLIFGLIAIIAFLIYSKEKKVNLSICGALVGVGIIAIIFFMPQLISILEHYIERGFDDTGRYELWALALDLFKESPIFGVGMQANTYGFEYTMIHNTALQILACTGIIGSLVFIAFYVVKYKVFFTKFNLYKLMMLCSVLICEGYGMIDQSCTDAFFYIYTFIILMAMDEDTNKIKQEQSTIDLVS